MHQQMQRYSHRLAIETVAPVWMVKKVNMNHWPESNDIHSTIIQMMMMNFMNNPNAASVYANQDGHVNLHPHMYLWWYFYSHGFYRWVSERENIIFWFFIFSIKFWFCRKQGMYFTYFVSVITTIEKLFQIQSKITGLLMSATEVGQICTSLFLTYFAGRGHRPRWIACGWYFYKNICYWQYVCCIRVHTTKKQKQIERITKNSYRQLIHTCALLLLMLFFAFFSFAFVRGFTSIHIYFLD